MRPLDRALIVVLLSAVVGCGDDSSSSGFVESNIGPWEQFRRDGRNTAQGLGDVFDSTATVKWAQPVDDAEGGAAGTLSPVTASPAIGLDGIVYIGSEAGTLKAFDAEDGEPLWTVDSCDKCAPEFASSLGPLISSPAAYSLDSTTTVMVGSDNGTLFVFEGETGEEPACTVCFRSDAARDFGAATRITRASVRSSPTFTLSELTLSVSTIIAGTAIEVERNGETLNVGKIYSINPNGTVRWQFPLPGEADIAPITASPSAGLGGVVLVADDGGTVYTLTNIGRLRSKVDVGSLRHPLSLFAHSTVSPDAVFIGSADGTVHAFNGDGSLRFAPLRQGDARCPDRPADGSGFASSLAVGLQNLGFTPTPTATVPPDVTPEPEPTPTPLTFNSTVYGVTSTGTLLVIDAATGRCVSPTGPLPTPVTGEVVSSPAQSADLFIVFGTTEGYLYAVNSGTGNLPQEWSGPLRLTDGAPIRSSPAISEDGTIYIGADDGMVYAVGKLDNP
jgi:outer membrane protein assembly factor BamB